MQIALKLRYYILDTLDTISDGLNISCRMLLLITNTYTLYRGKCSPPSQTLLYVYKNILLQGYLSFGLSSFYMLSKGIWNAALASEIPFVVFSLVSCYFCVLHVGLLCPRVCHSQLSTRHQQCAKVLCENSLGIVGAAVDVVFAATLSCPIKWLLIISRQYLVNALLQANGFKCWP